MSARKELAKRRTPVSFAAVLHCSTFLQWGCQTHGSDAPMSTRLPTADAAAAPGPLDASIAPPEAERLAPDSSSDPEIGVPPTDLAVDASVTPATRAPRDAGAEGGREPIATGSDGATPAQNFVDASTERISMDAASTSMVDAPRTEAGPVGIPADDRNELELCTARCDQGIRCNEVTYT
jgi:hypothetical protein